MNRLQKEIKPNRWQHFKMRWLLILGVIGPGIIAGTADNDAGGITTYSVVGASFGYKMMWILLIITFILGITQEMGARLGLVTGKGLAALLRENFSLKITTFIVFVTFIANWANILAEYAGISSVADIYGIPRYIIIPFSAFFIWFVVYKGSFKLVQKVFLTSSLLFFSYILAAFFVHPNWKEAVTSLYHPTLEFSPDFFYTAVALIGTTITAWGQFFVQSYYVDKGVVKEHLKYSRWDIFGGVLWTNLVAFFIIVATAATLYKAGISINDASQAAAALAPFAGVFAKHLFAWGLLNASLLGLAAVSMTSSYVVTEAFGWEGRVDLKKESPAFYKLFAICIFSTAATILIPNVPLIPILVGSQALNTFILPLLFGTILILLNKKDLLGKFRNNLTLNIISIISVIFIVVMAMAMVVMGFIKS